MTAAKLPSQRTRTVELPDCWRFDDGSGVHPLRLKASKCTQSLQ
ncbi:hypothetical protein LINGRAHAP2_LOCUS14633, partial [Linum grandiflorum]